MSSTLSYRWRQGFKSTLISWHEVQFSEFQFNTCTFVANNGKGYPDVPSAPEPSLFRIT